MSQNKTLNLNQTSDGFINKETIEHLFTAFNQIPFNRTLGLQLEKLEENKVILHFDMKAELIGNFLQGMLHGGVISSVLDMAGGMLVMTHVFQRYHMLPPEEVAVLVGKTTTVSLNVNYIHPGKGFYFNAEANLIKLGKKIAFTEMKLTNDDQILIATANGTYLVK